MDDFTTVSNWLISVFQKLWLAFGTWGIFGFALIFFPIMRKLLSVFRKLINKSA